MTLGFAFSAKMKGENRAAIAVRSKDFIFM
jgi:hypothetical protein